MPPQSSRSKAPLPVEIGQVIGGKYVVERKLGEGGMGAVLAVRHIELKQRFAIKVLLPEAVHVNESRARFMREARAAATIKSEHVARVVDVGTLDDGLTPMMVMEHLEGCDLQATLEAEGPLPVARAVDYVLQACEAIAEAHSLGIVHRDIKPSNFFLTRRADGSPCVKVLDFGISKMALTEQTGAETAPIQTALLLGSPYYMSPEQVRAAPDIDGRTDIWSLGVTLYQFLTGAWPFTGTGPQLFAAILEARVPKMKRHRPEVPDALDGVVKKCLEKRRAERWPHVGELALALVPFGSKQGLLSAERAAKIAASSGRAGASGEEDEAPPSSHEDTVTRRLQTRQSAPKQALDRAAVEIAQGAHTGGAWGGTLALHAARAEEAKRVRWMAVLAVMLVVGGVSLAWVLWWVKQRPDNTGVAATSAPTNAAPQTVEMPPTAAPTQWPTASAPAINVAQPYGKVPDPTSTVDRRPKATKSAPLKPTPTQIKPEPPRERSPKDPFEEQR